MSELFARARVNELDIRNLSFDEIEGEFANIRNDYKTASPDESLDALERELKSSLNVIAERRFGGLEFSPDRLNLQTFDGDTSSIADLEAYEKDQIERVNNSELGFLYNDQASSIIRGQIDNAVRSINKEVDGQFTFLERVKDGLGAKRAVEGFGTRLASLDKSGKFNSVVRRHIRSNPDGDNDFYEQLAQAGGGAVVDIGVVTGATVAGTLATGNPVTGGAIGASAGLAFNAATRYNDSYRTALALTGDKDLAHENGVNNTPVALIDTLGDLIIGGRLAKIGGKVNKSVRQSLEAAGDTELRRQIVRNALKEGKIGAFVRGSSTSAAAGAVSEGVAEGLSTIASGAITARTLSDDKFLEDALKEAPKAALMGAIIGGVISGVPSGLAETVNTTARLRNEESILDLAIDSNIPLSEISTEVDGKFILNTLEQVEVKVGEKKLAELRAKGPENLTDKEMEYIAEAEKSKLVDEKDSSVPSVEDDISDLTDDQFGGLQDIDVSNVRNLANETNASQLVDDNVTTKDSPFTLTLDQLNELNPIQRTEEQIGQRDLPNSPQELTDPITLGIEDGKVIVNDGTHRLSNFNARDVNGDSDVKVSVTPDFIENGGLDLLQNQVTSRSTQTNEQITNNTEATPVDISTLTTEERVELADKIVTERQLIEEDGLSQTEADLVRRNLIDESFDLDNTVDPESRKRVKAVAEKYKNNQTNEQITNNTPTGTNPAGQNGVTNDQVSQTDQVGTNTTPNANIDSQTTTPDSTVEQQSRESRDGSSQPTNTSEGQVNASQETQAPARKTAAKKTATKKSAKSKKVNVGKRTVNVVNHSPTKAVSQVVKVAEKVFGAEVIFVDHPSSNFHGARELTGDRRIIINTNSSRPILTTLSHELTHHIELTSPKLYAKIVEGITKGGLNSSQFGALTADKYKGIYNKSQFVSEYVADFMGQAIQSPVLFNSLVNKLDADTGRSFVEVVNQKLQEFIQALRNTFNASKGDFSILENEALAIKHIADSIKNYQRTDRGGKPFLFVLDSEILNDTISIMDLNAVEYPAVSMLLSQESSNGLSIDSVKGVRDALSLRGKMKGAVIAVQNELRKGSGQYAYRRNHGHLYDMISDLNEGQNPTSDRAKATKQQVIKILLDNGYTKQQANKAWQIGLFRAISHRIGSIRSINADIKIKPVLLEELYKSAEGIGGAGFTQYMSMLSGWKIEARDGFHEKVSKSFKKGVDKSFDNADSVREVIRNANVKKAVNNIASKSGRAKRAFKKLIRELKKMNIIDSDTEMFSQENDSDAQIKAITERIIAGMGDPDVDLYDLYNELENRTKGASPEVLAAVRELMGEVGTANLEPAQRYISNRLARINNESESDTGRDVTHIKVFNRILKDDSLDTVEQKVEALLQEELYEGVNKSDLTQVVERDFNTRERAKADKKLKKGQADLEKSIRDANLEVANGLKERLLSGDPEFSNTQYLAEIATLNLSDSKKKEFNDFVDSNNRRLDKQRDAKTKELNARKKKADDAKKREQKAKDDAAKRAADKEYAKTHRDLRDFFIQEMKDGRLPETQYIAEIKSLDGLTDAQTKSALAVLESVRDQRARAREAEVVKKKKAKDKVKADKDKLEAKEKAKNERHDAREVMTGLKELYRKNEISRTFFTEEISNSEHHSNAEKKRLFAFVEDIPFRERRRKERELFRDKDKLDKLKNSVIGYRGRSILEQESPATPDDKKKVKRLTFQKRIEEFLNSNDYNLATANDKLTILRDYLVQTNQNKQFAQELNAYLDNDLDSKLTRQDIDRIAQDFIKEIDARLSHVTESIIEKAQIELKDRRKLPQLRKAIRLMYMNPNESFDQAFGLQDVDLSELAAVYEAFEVLDKVAESGSPTELFRKGLEVDEMVFKLFPRDWQVADIMTSHTTAMMYGSSSTFMAAITTGAIAIVRTDITNSLSALTNKNIGTVAGVSSALTRGSTATLLKNIVGIGKDLLKEGVNSSAVFSQSKPSGLQSIDTDAGEVVQTDELGRFVRSNAKSKNKFFGVARQVARAYFLNSAINWHLHSKIDSLTTQSIEEGINNFNLQAIIKKKHNLSDKNVSDLLKNAKLKTDVIVAKLSDDLGGMSERRAHQAARDIMVKEIGDLLVSEHNISEWNALAEAAKINAAAETGQGQAVGTLSKEISRFSNSILIKASINESDGLPAKALKTLAKPLTASIMGPAKTVAKISDRLLWFTPGVGMIRRINLDKKIKNYEEAVRTFDNSKKGSDDLKAFKKADISFENSPAMSLYNTDYDVAARKSEEKIGTIVAGVLAMMLAFKDEDDEEGKSLIEITRRFPLTDSKKRARWERDGLNEWSLYIRSPFDEDEKVGFNYGRGVMQEATYPMIAMSHFEEQFKKLASKEKLTDPLAVGNSLARVSTGALLDSIQLAVAPIEASKLITESLSDKQFKTKAGTILSNMLPATSTFRSIAKVTTPKIERSSENAFVNAIPQFTWTDRKGVVTSYDGYGIPINDNSSAARVLQSIGFPISITDSGVPATQSQKNMMKMFNKYDVYPSNRITLNKFTNQMDTISDEAKKELFKDAGVGSLVEYYEKWETIEYSKQFADKLEKLKNKRFGNKGSLTTSMRTIDSLRRDISKRSFSPAEIQQKKSDYDLVHTNMTKIITNIRSEVTREIRTKNNWYKHFKEDKEKDLKALLIK